MKGFFFSPKCPDGGSQRLFLCGLSSWGPNLTTPTSI